MALTPLTNGESGLSVRTKINAGLAAVDAVAAATSNVDNTSDASKPVSAAQQAALNLKAPLASPAFTGTPTGITKAHVGLPNADNTSDANKPVSTAQQAALDAKAPLASPAFTGTPTGITKTHVGLGNVDNTSDVNKPVSTAQQAALNGKQGLNGTLTYLATAAGGTAADVKTLLSLSNVNNTSDMNKPVSTAQQAAIALATRAQPSVYLGQVATSGLVPDIFYAPNKQMTTRTPHWMRESVTSIQLMFPNWYVAVIWGPADGSEAALGAAPMTIEASIEYPAGTFTRVQFSGVNQGAIPAGQNLLSDAVSVTIPDGAQFWVRTYCTNATDGLPFMITPNFGNQMEIGATVTNKVVSGTVAGNTANCYGPIAIIGLTRKASVAIVGDSRATGYADTPDNTLHLGAYARAIGHALPYANLAVSGDRASYVTTKYARRAEAAAYCTHVLYTYGINDIAQGRTAAQVAADVQTFLGVTGIAGKPIWIVTLEPALVTTTDAYVTETNQTIGANNSVRNTYNYDYVRGGVSGVQGIIDVAQVLESPTTSGKYLATGGRALTGDGTHPNRRGTAKVVSANIIPVGNFVR